MTIQFTTHCHTIQPCRLLLSFSLVWMKLINSIVELLQIKSWLKVKWKFVPLGCVLSLSLCMYCGGGQSSHNGQNTNSKLDCFQRSGKLDFSHYILLNDVECCKYNIDIYSLPPSIFFPSFSLWRPTGVSVHVSRMLVAGGVTHTFVSPSWI